jgi:Helix-hairpin-helix motif
MSPPTNFAPDSPGREAPIGWTVLGVLSLLAIVSLGTAWWVREYRGDHRAPAADSLRLKLDINSASAGELELLPGIGPGRAAKIVAVRRKRGGFRRLQELDERELLGPGSALRLAPYLKPLPAVPAGSGSAPGDMKGGS